jgi:hypothetical protein
VNKLGRFACATALVVAGVAATSGTSTASATASRVSHVLLRVHANESTNWSGYNQGSAALGGVMFNEIAGTWTVPTPSAHQAGEDEYSSDWIGIGGGCVDAGCTVGDNTLIQTGTEQDIAADGTRSYSAWWEIIPEPETVITTLTVHGGDRMSAELHESVAGSNVWVITLKDVTTHQSFTTTTPYSSSHLTAEWIQERPTLIDSSGGVKLAPLPKLTNPKFDLGTVNSAAPQLAVAQEILMTNSASKVIARPSAPDPDADGFRACTYAATCATPTSS